MIEHPLLPSPGRRGGGYCMGREKADGRTLLVRNLQYNTPPEDVRERFKEYGNILDVYLPKDRESGRRRGFGFVEFDSKDDAENAMEQLQGIELDGRSIQIIVAQKGREVKPSNKQAQPDHNGGGRDERKRREKPEESRRRRSRSKSRESDRDADKERSGEKRKHSRRSRSRSKSRRRRKRSRSASEEYK